MFSVIPLKPNSIRNLKGIYKSGWVSSVFRFIWGWEEPVWGLPFQFHGAFIMDLYVLISMKGPWYAIVIWAQKRSALKPTTALVRSHSLMNNSMICFIASNSILILNLITMLISVSAFFSSFLARIAPYVAGLASKQEI